MFELRCTVRQCDCILRRSEFGLTCDRGHHFDRAKQGYWNLLQPQDRRSKNPGDCEDAVDARHRWLQRGHASGLIDVLRQWIDPTIANVLQPIRILDLGCGEGTFGPTLFSEHAEFYCGIDLSKKAIKLAVRQWPSATWVLANADRTLPVTDDSVDRIVSLFGRRPISEIVRVLKPDGIFLVAVPGEMDLIELRERVQTSGHRRSRWETIVGEFANAGLRCVEHRTWSKTAELSAEEIADALAMTYRGARHSEQARLESIGHRRVTLEADLMWFQR